ncbi:MAG TPA: C25 family cysteine peptidase, partial [Blastocatellia bacterium]|nr:C25 family cysteine peptidase [Blastocatellia bacterium]
LDLNGNRALHGPFGIQQQPGKPPARSLAATLSQIGRTPSRSTQAASVHQLVSSERRIQQQQELSAASAVKITIREEGWYSVKRQELLAAGLDPNSDPRKLQLYLHGQQVPISVVGEEGQSFDSIEFYGTGQDTPSTDGHVYWLTSTGRDGLRINHVKGDGARQTAASFPFTVERKDRTIYFSGLRNGDKENFFGPVISQLPIEQTLTLSHLASSSNATARLEVKLQGVTMVSHMVGVQLNGTFVGQVFFNGQAEGSLAMDASQSVLREGVNIVSLTGQGGPSDISLVASIRITYQHAFTVDGDSLRFLAPGNQEVRIEGFSSAAVRAIDITDLDSPTEIEGKAEEEKSGFALTVISPFLGNRTLIAFSDSEKKHPASIEANVSSSWRRKEQAADLVIITRRDFFASADRLKTARQKQGLQVALVDIEDIYDEFNYGEKSPETVKDFLSFTGSNWKLAPRFVLMIGDASFDTRNYLGAGDFDLVPTKLLDTEFMETASDDWLADFNNDALPEMALGRLPARTSDEADVMIAKILDYASALPSEEALLVADLNDGYDFETATRQLRPLLPASLRIEEIDRGALDPATAKRRLLEGITRGPLVVNYAGHGNVDMWRGELLTGADASGLANSGKPSVFVMMTCLNGYFQDPLLNGLAESLMKVERGGAVAVWASSGMTLPTDQWLMDRQLYRLLFGRRSVGAPPMTLGEAVVRAKASIGDRDIRHTWILFGDPTMRVR